MDSWGCNSEGKKRVRKRERERERERKKLTLRKREKSVCIESLGIGQPKVGYSNPPNK